MSHARDDRLDEREEERVAKLNKPKCIIVDLEGTLSDHSARVHFYDEKDYERYNAGFIDDPVNEEFVDAFIKDHPSGIKMILCTAKSIEYATQVHNWLESHSLSHLIWSKYYRDKLDTRPSVLVKKDQLKEIQEHYIVICAYDDRQANIDMYREHGVTACLVHSGSTQSNKNRPDVILNDAADLYKSKNAEYGDGYKGFGGIMGELFPNGLALVENKDFSRFAILNIMTAKLDRYCKNFKTGGHKDSLADISVYAAMLQEVDDEL